MPKHELPQVDRVVRQTAWMATKNAWLKTSIVRAMAEFHKSWDNAWQRGYNVGLQVHEATTLAQATELEHLPEELDRALEDNEW